MIEKDENRHIPELLLRKIIRAADWIEDFGAQLNSESLGKLCRVIDPVNAPPGTAPNLKTYKSGNTEEQIKHLLSEQNPDWENDPLATAKALRLVVQDERRRKKRDGVTSKTS